MRPFPYTDAPMIGDFFDFLELHKKLEEKTEVKPPRVNFRGGYYSPNHGRFFPYPVP